MMIEIRHKQVLINGHIVAEPYAVHDDETEYNQPGLPEPYESRDNFGPLTIRTGEYFVLGDDDPIMPHSRTVMRHVSPSVRHRCRTLALAADLAFAASLRERYNISSQAKPLKRRSVRRRMKRDKPEEHIAGEAMRDAVREQIKAGDPPEAKRTFERLRSRGLSVEQAIEFMAAALAAEIFEVLKNQQPYDRERYETALRALPTLPWERDA